MPAKCDDTVIHIYRRNDTQWYIVVLYQNGKRLRRSGRALDLNVNRYTPEEAENIVRKQLGIHEPMSGNCANATATPLFTSVTRQRNLIG